MKTIREAFTKLVGFEVNRNWYWIGDDEREEFKRVETETYFSFTIDDKRIWSYLEDDGFPF